MFFCIIDVDCNYMRHAMRFMGTGDDINDLECTFGIEWMKGNKETGEFYFKDKNGKKILINIGEYVSLNYNDTVTIHDPETFNDMFRCLE